MPTDRLATLVIAPALIILGTPSTQPAETTVPSVVAPSAVQQDTIRADLIDYGSGLFAIRVEDRLDAAAARAVLDGIEGFLTRPDIGPEGPDEPVQLLIELPAPTTFTGFAVPPMSRFGCCSGTHIRTVTVEGSPSGPDDGFVELVSFDVVPEVYDADQEFPAASGATVRWLRVSLAGRQVPDPDDCRGTTFTDLRGYGEQEAREAGRLAFRRKAGRPGPRRAWRWVPSSPI